jgi:SAM-dependent methyltransferase
LELHEYEVMYRAESRHWWFQGSRRVILSLVRRHRPAAVASRPPRLLDMGCGTGITLDRLGRGEGLDAYGVDLEGAALSFCRTRGLTRLVRGSVTALPFADATFDVVTALDVVEHVEDDRAALAEAARVLRPGGIAVVTVPAHGWLWSDHDRALHHQRRYGRTELAACLDAAGLVPLRLSFYNTALFPAVAAVRLGQRLRRRMRPPAPDATPRSDVRLPPAPANALLRELFAAEGVWLARADLPFGVSLVAVARRA